MFSILNYIDLDTLMIFLFEIDHFQIFCDLSIFDTFFNKKSDHLNKLEAIEVIFTIFLG